MKKNKKTFIDFKTLTERQLKDLSDKWEKDAVIFEQKFDRYLHNVGDSTEEHVKEKTERLWNTGHKLWTRLKIIEDFRKRLTSKKNLNVVK